MYTDFAINCYKTKYIKLICTIGKLSGQGDSGNVLVAGASVSCHEIVVDVSGHVLLA